MHTHSRSLLDLWEENRRAPKDPEHNLTARLRELSRRTDAGLVRSIARQNARSAHLLPPPDTAVFRPLSPESLARVQERAAQEKARKKEQKKEGKKDVEVAEEDLPKPSGDLEEGEVLPFIYGDPPSELFYTPLEELDPFYQAQKTFIVINKGNTIFRFNAEPAFYLLTPFNIVRRGAIRVVTHSFFHLFIMLTILLHFAFELVPRDSTPWWRGIAELVFTGVFTLEALFKVLSRGFFIGRFTYLRDPWNWLDFLLVIFAYLNMFLADLDNLVALRMFRVLRALNSNSLKTFRGALGRSVRNLAGVMLFVLFCLCFLALVGLQLFMGSLRNKCMMWFVNDTESGLGATPSPGYDYNYDDYNHSHHTSHFSVEANYYFIPGHMDSLLCGNASDAGVCPDGYTCIRHGQNPNYGYTSYDNFGWAFLSTFRLMTHDFWENLFQLTMRSTGKVYSIFFAIVLLGCFYLANLILAVIAMAYTKQNQAAITRAREEEEEYQRILTQLKKQGSKGMEKMESELEEARRPCRRGCDRFAQMCLKWDCCGPWRVFKKLVHAVMMDPFMDLFITLCVVANTIFMALEHYPMSYEFEEMLSVAHLVFTAIFTAEMILKIIAMDPYNYFRVGWNVFDSLTIMLNLMELSLDFWAILRLFRLLRIFRLGKVWPTFNMLIKIIRISVRALAKVALVLLGTVITFAVVGNQLFGMDYQSCVCKISPDCELPRWHMADFFHSFLLVYRVLCGEWIEVWWDLAEVGGLVLSLVFIFSLLVVGYLVVSHVLLCLLLTSFRGDYLTMPKDDRNMVNMRIAIRRLYSFINVRLLGRKPKAGSDVSGGEEGDPKKDIKMAAIDSSTAPIAKAELDLENLDDENDTDAIKKTHSAEDHRPVEVPIAAEKDGPPDCFAEGCIRRCPCLAVDPMRGRGKVWWNIRKTCFTIVEHRCFKAFIITIVILSCAALAFEDIYLEHRNLLKTILEYAEQVFTWVFVVEMLLKWVAYGFNRYFTNPWCWLEFIIVNVSLVNSTAIALGFSGVGPLKSMRALRVPSWFGGSRVVLNTLFGAIPTLFDVLLACITFWLIFAIMGVELFAGKFFYCFNSTSEEYFHESAIQNRSECLELMYNNNSEVSWKNQKINFDNVNNGFLALFTVATFKGWLEVVYAAADSRHVEDQPVFETNLYSVLYFVIFIIGSLFTFSLFLGVFIDNYRRQKAKVGGKGLFMTEGQRRCWTVELKSKPQKPIPRPQNRVQGLVFDLVTKPLFEFVMMALVCIYMVILMMESYDQTLEMDVFLYWGSLVYILILIIECALKLYALRRDYFTIGWNIFDFVVVLVSIAGIFLADLMEKYFVSPTLFRIVRAIRIVAILRLIRRTEGINKLLTSLMMSIPAIFNLVLLLFIVMFVYAIFGMWLFAYVKKMAAIDDMMNFETFGSSMLCMFQVATLAGWDGLLLPSLSETVPDCYPDFENPGSTVRGNCGNRFAGIVFFCSYVSICLFFMINMFIAIILENFRVTTKKRAHTLREEDLEMFYETWEKFDPDATRYLDYTRLSDFCDTLKEPLRIPKPNTVKLITMNLPMTPGNKIHCRDVLTALATEVLGDSEEMDALKSSMEEKFKMDDPSKSPSEPMTTTLKHKQEEVAAGIIQRAFRKHRPKTDQTAEDKEAPGKDQTAAKQPMNSLDGYPAAEEDPAVQETQPLMGSEDGMPAADPPGERLTEVILHSTPSPTPQPTAPPGDSSESV